MKTWVVVCEVLPMTVVLLHAAARLWPRRAGYYYLRYSLSRRGIQIKEIPSECIFALVEDALDHARTACASGSRPGATADHTVPHVEFERMLRTHCVVVHALLTGTKTAEVNVVEKQRIGTDVSWERQRTILCRYNLPVPASQIAIG